MLIRSIASLLALVSWCASTTVWAQPKNSPFPSNRPKAQPMLPSKVVKVSAGSIDTFIQHLYLSHPFDLATSANTSVAEEMAALEAAALSDFINGRGEFDNKDFKPKKVFLIRYTLGHPAMTQALIEAKQAGAAQIQIITDLNAAYSGIFQKGETYHSRFKEVKVANPEMAGELQKLLAAGFTFNGEKYGIFSQPLYSKEDTYEEGGADPIMHIKRMLLTSGDDVVWNSIGSANLSTSPRYNRILRLSPGEHSDADLKHVQQLIDNYREGKPTSALPASTPVRWEYADGTFAELAYTDGKYNTNFRIVDLLKKISQNPKELRLKRVLLSENLITFRPFIEELRTVMKQTPDVPVTGIFDDSNVDEVGYGLAQIIAGYTAHRPKGEPVEGFPFSARKNVSLYVYQRGVDGVPEITLGGPPVARHLWHDKTALLWVEENGETWVYLLTGTFNLSGNFGNAEEQYWMRLKASSPWVRAFENSVLKVIENEPEYAIPMELATFRKSLASQLGYSVLEIPLDFARATWKKIETGQFAQVPADLRAFKQNTPSTIQPPVSQEDFNRRMHRMERIAQWFQKVQQGRQTEGQIPVVAQRMHSLFYAIRDWSLSEEQIKAILRSIIFDRDVPAAQLEEEVTQGYQALIQGDCDPLFQK